MVRLKAQLKKLAAEKESSSATSLSSLNALSTSTYTDLTETNALLLHPSQFGMVPGIGSPSRRGADDDREEPARRKPRRRAGEVEELLNFGVGINFDPLSNTGKRKRANRRDRDTDREPEDTNANIHEATSPSSGSATANLDSTLPNIATSDYQRRRDEILKQVYAPVYSFDKLFTEKELQLAGTRASLAAVRFFTERPQMHYEDGDSENDDDGGIATPHPEVEDEESGNGGGGGGNYNTRSNPPRHHREIENMVLNGVPGFGMTFVNKAGVAPPPPALRSEDADADLVAMRGEARGEGERDGKKARRG
jgi:hypothetical protein